MLRILKLRAKLKEKNTLLEKLRAKKEELAQKRAELETALDEAKTDEDISLVNSEIENLEKEVDETVKEIAGEDAADMDAEVEKAEKEVAEIESEINSILEKTQRAAEKSAVQTRAKEPNGGIEMKRRTRFFGMDAQQREALIKSSEVQEFLTRTRNLSAQSRNVKGAELLIPDILLDLIKENIEKYSQLIKFVRLKPVKGHARQPIMGSVPKGIWVEMTGALQELKFNFNEAEVDGYKVGGYVPIPNSSLNDDESLLIEIIEGVGAAIGLALDEAIIYGKGTKQPLGIVTRLAQKVQPEGYSEKARKWENLSTSNILKINETTPEALWAKIVEHSGAAKAKNSIGKSCLFCVVNTKTLKTLLSKLISFNVAGMQVAQLSELMPLIGGKIIELDCMADGDILYGYGDLYLLAERDGTYIAQSEHAQFIEDNTVVKGIARYDGLPVIAEGFVLMNINNKDPKIE